MSRCGSAAAARSFVASRLRTWNWSIELNAVCLGLTIVRGLADFGLCHVYYEAVLGGDYRREKLA